MSEKQQQECNMENETLKLICEIEKNYSENFTAQAKFLKELTNNAMKKNSKIEGMGENSYLDPFTFILDFLGRGQEDRKKLSDKIMENNLNEQNKVLFLGIQNSTRAKFAHLKKEVNKDCNEDNENKNIQECLKSIFCGTKNDENCLKELPSYDKLTKLFVNPISTVTSVLYWLYPESYIPFDENSKKLYKKLELKCDDEKIEIKDDWECYNKIIEALKQIPNDNKDKLFVDNNEKFKPSMIIALSMAAWTLK